MSTYTIYKHTISGDIATLEDWIKDGKLEAIELNSDDECFLTNRLFPGWFGDAGEGEKYQSEWACYADDEDGERYKIVWMFPAVKGEEPEDDGWPWDDESFIDRIETL